MTGTTRRRLLLGFAMLDLVVFGGWIAKEEVGRRRGVEVLLPVEGFDPRDLLSGHYVRFRLVAVREAAALSTGGPEDHVTPGDTAAYCLYPGEDGRHRVASRRVRPGHCALFISGVIDGSGQPDFGVNRFYVDERRQQEAAVVSAGPDTYMVARVDGRGRIHPVDLVVGGKSLGGR